MSGVIETTTLKAAASGDTVPMQTIVSGSAKAWARVNQTTPAIVDDFNVESLTDHGAGDFTLTLSVAMVNANYAIVASGDNYSSGSSTISCPKTGTTPTTSAVRVAHGNNSSGSFAGLDSPMASYIIFGD